MSKENVNPTDNETSAPPTPADEMEKEHDPAARPREIGGPKGLEPTRYGDWERNGRCSDF